MRRVAATLATALIASAVPPSAASARSASAPPGCHARWPVTAFLAGPVAQPVHSRQLPVACAVATGYATSETTLAVTNSGAILFSPASSENTLARSANGGRSWSLVGPTTLQYTSLWNTVDPQVVIDRRTGRAFWVHTTYTEDLRWPLPDQSPAAWLVPTAVANAHGFQVYASDDAGRSWRTADYRYANTADWEKLFVGPPRPASTGAPQPHGYPDVVYVCANAPQEVIGPGRVCYRSLDGGVTFTSLGFEVPSAAAPAFCPPLAANTGVVARDGDIYIPQSCAGGTYLAVSANEGASFKWLPVPGAPATNGLGASVQLAIDGSDDLYLLWLGAGGLKLAVSRDGALHWSVPSTVSPPSLHNVTLPALASGPRGRVGIVYYASAQPSAGTLSAYISQTSDALAPRPRFYLGALNAPSHPIFRNYGDSYSPRADFVGAAYDARGNLWGGVVEQLRPPDAASTIATTGYVGRLVFRRGRAASR